MDIAGFCKLPKTFYYINEKESAGVTKIDHETVICHYIQETDWTVCHGASGKLT